MSDDYYNCSGYVVNVVFTEGSEYPCYIAVGCPGYYKDFLHLSRRDAICQFAESSKALGNQVTLRARVTPGNNEVVRIGQAGTDAKFWIDYTKN